MSGGRVPSRFYTELPQMAIGNYNFTDDAGAQGTLTIFTVTGHVEVQGMFGICNSALTSGGAATIELGIVGDTAEFIAQATATELIADELWYDATPTTTWELIDLFAATRRWILTGQDAILTIATADLTAGDINFYALWRPLSVDGSVVAA